MCLRLAVSFGIAVDSNVSYRGLTGLVLGAGARVGGYN